MPYTGKEDLNGKDLVVRHTWGLGDVIYSTPAIKAIKEKYPDVRLTYISVYPQILEGNPAVNNNCHNMQFEDFLDMSDQLKASKWYFVNYDGPLKGGFNYKTNLRTKPGLNEYLYDLIRKDPKLLSHDELDFVNQAANTLTSRYKMIALDLYCAHLYVDPPNPKSIYYYPTNQELEFARKFLSSLKKRFKIITLMPHTSTFFKDYPHWREVIKLCPYSYYWLILDGVNRGDTWLGTNVYNCAGAFNLRQSAAIIIEGDMCCSSDTGLLYVKAARGGKCIVTYGPHEPEPFLYYFPSAKGLRVPHVNGLRPDGGTTCSVGCYIDTTACRPGGGPPPCLDQLTPRLVADAIMSHMEAQ